MDAILLCLAAAILVFFAGAGFLVLVCVIREARHQMQNRRNGFRGIHEDRVKQMRQRNRDKLRERRLLE